MHHSEKGVVWTKITQLVPEDFGLPILLNVCQGQSMSLVFSR